MEQDTQDEQEKNLKPTRRGSYIKWVAFIAVVVALGALAGWLWWQWQLCTDSKVALEQEKTQLQSQVQSLEKRLATASASPDADACSATVTQGLKDTIRDAIQSDNTAALEGYMADSLLVIIAASEFGATRTPTQAVADLNYIQDSSGWNFALPAATIASYLTGSYGSGSPGTNYFDATTYFGKASDNKLVAFNFDDCAKIDQVFLSASADLLP